MIMNVKGGSSARRPCHGDISQSSLLSRLLHPPWPRNCGGVVKESVSSLVGKWRSVLSSSVTYFSRGWTRVSSWWLASAPPPFNQLLFTLEKSMHPFTNNTLLIIVSRKCLAQPANIVFITIHIYVGIPPGKRHFPDDERVEKESHFTVYGITGSAH
jgi:hypothetical protein